jgi:putative membrane protein
LVTTRPFTPEQHRRIHAAIEEIERTTAADLDLVVTRVSDRYALYPLVWAAVSALLLTAVLVLIRPAIGARTALAFEFAVLIVATLIYSLTPVRLMLVPPRVKRAHARQLAHREFAAQYARGAVVRRRILLFVSLGERYVEIIADHETYAAADPDFWQKTVDDFVAAVQSGRIAEGILKSIDACGAVLHQKHPLA